MTGRRYRPSPPRSGGEGGTRARRGRVRWCLQQRPTSPARVARTLSPRKRAERVIRFDRASSFSRRDHRTRKPSAGILYVARKPCRSLSYAATIHLARHRCRYEERNRCDHTQDRSSSLGDRRRRSILDTSLVFHLSTGRRQDSTRLWLHIHRRPRKWFLHRPRGASPSTGNRGRYRALGSYG